MQYIACNRIAIELLYSRDVKRAGRYPAQEETTMSTMKRLMSRKARLSTAAQAILRGIRAENARHAAAMRRLGALACEDNRINVRYGPHHPLP